MPEHRGVADFRGFEEYRVAVEGGRLAVLRWPAAEPGAPVVLGVHGITANALSWASVAEALGGRVTLLAPDLRGRANSRDVAGSWGVAQHTRDLISVLDDAGLERALLAGHSMGAFVVCATAARHPDRVAAVVAVDGGVSLEPPEGFDPRVDPDAVLDAMIGPALRKLAMRFADDEAYLDFFRDHPSFVGNWTPQLTAYLTRDTLRLPEGGVASSCIEAAILSDGREILLDQDVMQASKRLAGPALLLYAERGMFNQPQGLYDAGRIAETGLDPTRMPAELVPDTNHYTVMAPGAGADAVAAAVLRLSGLNAATGGRL